MSERHGAITFKGNPLTLVGNELQQGDKLPDIGLLGTDLSEVRLSSYRGKVLVLIAVPSLDTAVCDLETKRFNDEAGRLGSKGVQFVAVSMDLPFAQGRWLQASGADNITALSDHRDGAFGEGLGLLIKELRLLARAVLVVDAEGKVSYLQLVREMVDEPDYDEVLEAIKALL
ncbi:MAG: thiol peroxidase [Candidatus Glassbacteria bacterium]|nr:thiol peroxidase [Candidatus Glassbacteria bacterium]